MNSLTKFCLLVVVAVSMYSCEKEDTRHQVLALTVVNHIEPLPTLNGIQMVNPLRIDSGSAGNYGRDVVQYTVHDRDGNVWYNVPDNQLTRFTGVVDPSWFIKH